MRNSTRTSHLFAFMVPLTLMTAITATAAAQEDSDSAPTAEAKVSVDASSSDEGSFGGAFAIGYLGQRWIPIATNPTFSDGHIVSMDADQGAVDAPVIGMRYWLSNSMGIDVGLGFRTQGGTATWTKKERNPNDPGVEPAKYEYQRDDLSQTGVLIHGGVPIALNNHKHYVFELVPEINVGFSTGTLRDQPEQPPSMATAPVGMRDIKLSGLRFDIGARVGTELHFGFIGVPNLALQATVGAYFSMQKIKADGGGHDLTNPNDPSSQAPKATYQHTSTSFSTTSFDSPWAIFQNTISALYYF